MCTHTVSFVRSYKWNNLSFDALFGKEWVIRRLLYKEIIQQQRLRNIESFFCWHSNAYAHGKRATRQTKSMPSGRGLETKGSGWREVGTGIARMEKSEKKSKYYDHSLNCIKMLLLLLLGIPFFTYVPLNTHTHTIDIHLIPTSVVNPFKRFNSFSTPLSCTRTLVGFGFGTLLLCLWILFPRFFFSCPFHRQFLLHFLSYAFSICKLRIETENSTFCYVRIRFNRENARRRNDKCLPMTYFRMLDKGIYCHTQTHLLTHSRIARKCDQSLQIKCNFYLRYSPFCDANRRRRKLLREKKWSEN